MYNMYIYIYIYQHVWIYSILNIDMYIMYICNTVQINFVAFCAERPRANAARGDCGENRQVLSFLGGPCLL